MKRCIVESTSRYERHCHFQRKLFSRKKKDTESKKEDKKKLESLDRVRRKEIKDLHEKLGRKLDQVLEGENLLASGTRMAKYYPCRCCI